MTRDRAASDPGPTPFTVIARALLFLVVALAPCLRAEAALPVQAPCDDPSYARDFKVGYPGEIDKLWTEEQKQRDAWSARADAIGKQVVGTGAASAQAYATFRLALARRPDIALLDEQITHAVSDFRERNVSLQGVSLISPLDPMRPNRAWCVMASSALDALKSKLALEERQWQLIDQALLVDAANRGVRFAP
jgi:hypothetical protein